MKVLVAIAAAALLSTPAFAQDLTIDQSKLYLSSPEACAAAEGGAMTEGDFQNLRFGDSAVQFSEEAWCGFYQVLEGAQEPDLIVTALCNFGGQKFADTLLISPLDETTIQLQSQRQEVFTAMAAGDVGYEPSQYTTTFTRCALDGFPQ